MKSYLGDGAYVDFDGYALVLTTEDGMRETNRIVLEPEVYMQLLAYVAVLKRREVATKDDAVGQPPESPI